MLLGTTSNKDIIPGVESLIIQLISQQRYAEAYELLLNQEPANTVTSYNVALCLHWAGNFSEALNVLNSIRIVQPLNSNTRSPSNPHHQEIRNKQNQTDDYLQAISDAYAKRFPVLVQDAIIRLKTECWLQLGDYAKVIATATPIANKGYQNITEALKSAHTANDRRI